MAPDKVLKQAAEVRPLLAVSLPALPTYHVVPDAGDERTGSHAVLVSLRWFSRCRPVSYHGMSANSVGGAATPAFCVSIAESAELMSCLKSMPAALAMS